MFLTIPFFGEDAALHVSYNQEHVVFHNFHIDKTIIAFIEFSGQLDNNKADMCMKPYLSLRKLTSRIVTRFRRVRLLWRLLRLTGLFLFLAGLILGTVIAIQARRNQEFFANQAAETLRAIVGKKVVGKAECMVFKLAHRTRRLLRSRPGRANPRVVERLRQPFKDSPPPATDAGAGPPPIEPLLESPTCSGEGRWQPLEAAHPGLWLTRIRPNAKDSTLFVNLVAIDLNKLQLTFFPGTEVTNKPELSSIPASMRSSLVAVFNGGWREHEKETGQRKAGILYRPLKNDKGTIVLAGTGVDICEWNPAVAARYPTADIRQNLPMFLIKGQAGESLLKYLRRTSLDFPTYRSALGLTTDRRWLFYGVGAALEPLDLATAFRLAACPDVINLDQNHGNVFFDLVKDNQPQPQLWSIETSLQCTKDQKVLTGSNRDFFCLNRIEQKSGT